jgi:glycosyltransferase involved in cell wall biosynthesis
MAEEGLHHVLSRFPRARLRIAGYLDPPESLGLYRDRIDRLPFMDFLGLQKAISEVSLNISPLQHNAFSYSKSELKYFEAAAAGVLTVASPVPVFTAAITHGHNGYLADALEWPEVFDRALSASVEDHRQRLDAALRHVTDHYTVSAVGPTIRGTISQLSSL